MTININIAILEKTVREIATPGKGILAADESLGTIEKRFQAINLESTEENRRAYRNLLFTTSGIEEYISGVILFEETLYQATLQNNIPFPQLLAQKGIVPGIKVDKGLIALANFADNKLTQGLDGLGTRLEEYKKQGARFAKWRAVFPISATTPSKVAIKVNAAVLAQYAAICQELAIVPIVEPEVLMDGDHTIEHCAEISRNVFHGVFHALHRHKVALEGIILKPSMVISGKTCQKQANIEKVAQESLKILRETVPAAVQTINFLSGGQTSEVATAHLNAMNSSKTIKPWYLSFSYGRALQEYALKAWNGKAENVAKAQAALYKRAKLNGLACLGKYTHND